MKDKVAVITGSSKGIGKAIALTLAKTKEYTGIITNARNRQEAQVVSDEIKNLGCESLQFKQMFQRKQSALV